MSCLFELFTALSRKDIIFLDYKYIFDRPNSKLLAVNQALKRGKINTNPSADKGRTSSFHALSQKATITQIS